MLAYLSQFYDLEREETDSDTDSSGESREVDPERAVELLEEILGLNEEQFGNFRSRHSRSPQERHGQQAASRQTPSDGLPTVPFTESTAPFTNTPERLRALTRRPRDAGSTIPDSEESPSL